MKTTRQNNSYFLKPENLYVAALLGSKGIWVSRIMEDKYHFLLDSLYIRRILSEAKADEFLPVSVRILEQYLTTRHASAIKANLVTAGVLNTDGEFKQTKKCLGYRFAPEFRGTFRAVPVNQESFARKIKNQNRNHASRVVGDCPALQHVFETLKKVTIDAAAAEAFTRENFPETWLDGADINENKRESRLRAIERLSDGDFSASLDAQGRFYNNWVQMAGDVRRFCTIGGAPICQADYSSLQPALLAMLYKSDCAEKRKFIALVSTGKFYQFLLDYYVSAGEALEFDLSKPEDKRTFKDLVFSNFLFCENRVVSPMRDVFSREFPILTKIIIGKKWKDNGDLPRELQRKEARLVLKTVLPRLIDDFPGIPLLSVHDCISTTAEFIGLVKDYMEREFFKAAGFPVTVKTEMVSIVGWWENRKAA